ncbi:MAG: hypothetical protein HOF01_01710 [Chloroflexi bacterium]|jgi:hypothetical protein|nr:hypothetical protein [Chloroflexota bacterium]
MKPSDNPQHFSDRAQEHQLVISAEDAANIGEVGASVASTYAAIRQIDTTGFEPAAIFVPTPSKRKDD